MSDFEKLKDMDLIEIHKKTNITVAKLNDIINKNFDNIDPIRAMGFVKIIERELGLNLQDWLAEYKSYKSNGEVDSNVKIEAQKDISSKKENEIQIKEQTLQIKQKPEPKKTNNSKLSDIKIEIVPVKKAKSYKKVGIVLIAILLIFVLIIFFIFNTTQESTKETKIDSKKQESIINNESNQPEQITIEEEVEEEQEDNQTDSNIEEKPQEHTITIIPNSQLWFEWVEVDNKKIDNKYINNKNHVIKTSGAVAFYFGAMLTMDIDGQENNINNKTPSYILYEPQTGIKTITRREYTAIKGQAK